MKQANNITEYLEIVNYYKKYPIMYFRGQREVHKTFPPSISRDPGYLSNENNIYNDAIQMCESEFEDIKNPLGRLAKMQHYGIPTRLVDLTIKPLIALYFAVEKLNDKENSNGIIYLYAVDGVSFNSKEARVLSILPTLSHLDKDYIKEEYERIFEDTISYEEILEIVNTPTIVQHSTDLAKSNHRLY